MWLKNLGFVSFNKLQTRESNKTLPKVGTFEWDLAGPSYLRPLIGNSPNKPGFIVCDLFLGREISENGISPFIIKCKTLNSLNIGKCLQVFVADNYCEEAFKMVKNIGAIPATTNNLFGEEIANGLKYLIQILSEVAKNVISTDDIEKLFDKLGKIEGASINLRGALFEFIVANIYKEAFSPSFIKTNEIIIAHEYNKTIEVDIIAEKSNRSITFIECKGLGKNNILSEDYIKIWLQSTVPALRYSFLKISKYTKYNFIFQLWNTGIISQESEALINKAIKNTSKYTIEYLDKDKILAFAKQTKDAKTITLLKKFYIETDI
jgi:hypothetical protein